jgi:hypothetical protein
MAVRPGKPAKTPAKPANPPEDKVGYGHPPKATRFQKGQSGNPSGRPAGIKSLRSVLEEALAQRTTVRVQGRPKKITKLEAMTRKLADLAVEGDARVLRLLLNEIRLAEQRAAEEPATQDVLTAADREVIAALVARIGGRA